MLAGAGGKTTAAFSRHDDAVEAPRLRMLVLELLAGLAAGEAAAVAELAAGVAWHQFWLRAWGSTDSVSLTKDILAEADLLGVVANGALSEAGALPPRRPAGGGAHRGRDAPGTRARDPGPG